MGRELPGPRECGKSALLALQLHSPWTHSQPRGTHSLSQKLAEVLLGEAYLSRAGEEGFSEEVTPLQSPKDELAGSRGLESPLPPPHTHCLAMGCNTGVYRRVCVHVGLRVWERADRTQYVGRIRK